MKTVNVCPDAEMLSTYLDGKLDAALRGPLEDHISRCEECYFVVRETTLTWAESGEASTPLGGADAPERGAVVVGEFGAEAVTKADDGAIEVSPTKEPTEPVAFLSPPTAGSEPAQVAERQPRSFFARYVLPLAATVVVGVGAIALWKQTQSERQEPRAALVAAVGERRFFDARLTGGFKFGERISPKRSGGTPAGGGGATGPAAEDWEILAAAAKVKKDVGTQETAGDRGTLAAASLVLGDTEEAVRLLEQALREPQLLPKDEGLLRSDLAAAYLTRATVDDRADDLPRALESAARAVELDPTLREALFNKALALESLFLHNEAIKAWDALIATETDASWRTEAERRRDAIKARPTPDFDKLEKDIRGSLERGTDAQLDEQLLTCA